MNVFFFFLINGKVWTCFFPWRRSYDAVTKQMSHKWNLSLHYKKKFSPAQVRSAGVCVTRLMRVRVKPTLRSELANGLILKRWNYYCIITGADLYVTTRAHAYPSNWLHWVFFVARMVLFSELVKMIIKKKTLTLMTWRERTIILLTKLMVRVRDHKLLKSTANSLTHRQRQGC